MGLRRQMEPRPWYLVANSKSLLTETVLCHPCPHMECPRLISPSSSTLVVILVMSAITTSSLDSTLADTYFTEFINGESYKINHDKVKEFILPRRCHLFSNYNYIFHVVALLFLWVNSSISLNQDHFGINSSYFIYCRYLKGI